jgi:hypothetical protein
MIYVYVYYNIEYGGFLQVIPIQAMANVPNLLYHWNLMY